MKPVSESNFSRLQEETDHLERLHNVLSRLLDALEVRIDENKQKTILKDVRSIQESIGTTIVGIEECLTAIDQEEHEYFDDNP